MVAFNCFGCGRSSTLIRVDCTGPDGSQTLCSSCNKAYRRFRLPLFKLRSGSISARPSGGSIRVLATSFDTTSKNSQTVDMRSPVVRSATAAEHYAIQQTRRVLVRRQVMKTACFACRRVGGAHEIKFSGPDGPSTLCSTCNNKYLALNLPLFKHSSGTISAKPLKKSARVVAIGFDTRDKKGPTRRDYCKPIVRSSSLREHNFLLRQCSLDSAGMEVEYEGDKSSSDDDANSEESGDQNMLFLPAQYADTIVPLAKKGLPQTRRHADEVEDKSEPSSKRRRAKREEKTVSAAVMHKENTILSGSIQPQEAKKDKTGVNAAKVALRGFCVKATYHCGWGNERRMVFVPYGARFSAMERALRNLFGVQTNFSVFYTDSDGEEIAVSSDIEMHPLFAQAKLMKNCLRVHIRGTQMIGRDSK